MQRTAIWTLVAAVAIGSAIAGRGEEAKSQTPGQREQGFLLPNGWTITPAGRQVVLSDLPLNIIPLADNRRALVATSGYNAHELAVVDLESGRKGPPQKVRQSWFGLALTPEADRLWWSGGGGGALHQFSLKDGQLARADSGDPTPDGKADSPKQNFRSGITLDARLKRLYSLDIDAGELIVIDTSGKEPERRLKLGGRPYDVAIARNGSRLYVSDWAGRMVLAIDPVELRVVAKIAVGEHPNQIALHPRDDRLFVACASSNCVSVIDTQPRHRHRDDLHGAVSPGARREHARRAGRRRPTARRCSWPMPTTTAWPSSTSQTPSRSQVQGLHPHRLVSDGRGRHARRQAACWSASARGTRRSPTRSTGRRARSRSRGAIADDGRSRTSARRFRGAVDRADARRRAKLAAYTETVYATAPTPTSC